ncbi:hypothetical protein Dimus_035148 [Dionaea muscipula]
MSKKKAFSGSTMTLKDFHGGSIPSDIPLPSAPGVIVRTTDRPVYDRQTSWGNAGVRSDHRLRPNSSGSMRGLDDNTPFLTSTVNIGRHFDEDERKPLDGMSGTKRTVSDDSIRGMPTHVEKTKLDGGRFSSQQSSVLVPQVSGASSGSWSSRVVDGSYVGSNAAQATGGSHPNAWGVRKEVVGGSVMVPPHLPSQNVVSKFAQASALDKVSSGRWQTKPSSHHLVDVEVIRQSELQDNLNLKDNVTYEGSNTVKERAYDTQLTMRVERGLTIEDGIRRVQSPMSDAKMRNSDVKHVNELQQPAETSDWAKLKLSGRTKPQDATESSFLYDKQGFRAQSDVNSMETAGQLHGNTGQTKPGLSENESGNRLMERQRLNLKPRSLPFQQPEDTLGRERIAVFGGARPRETVLKERGVDDIVAIDHLSQAPSRVKNDVPSPRTETRLVNANSSPYSERGEYLHSDHNKTVKGGEKKDQRVDGDRADMQRRNWKQENWRNGRDNEKHHQQRQQERQPSPETWRKPVEQPKSAHAEISGIRCRKAVSAVELAQAFSRSVSGPKSPEQFSGQGGLPGRVQISFSRLTGPATTTRPQINGY